MLYNNKHKKYKNLEELLITKLKQMHKYDNLSFLERIDFDDEIKSFIPVNVSDDFIDKYYIFHDTVEDNTKRSLLVKYFKGVLDSAWILFLFLTILFSFKKTSSTFSFQSQQIDKKKDKDFIIKNSVVGSQALFWGIMESLQHFVVVTGGRFTESTPSKMASLVQVSLNAMHDCKIFIKHHNYEKTPKDYVPGDHWYKSVFSYQLKLDYEAADVFNVEQKLFRSPPQVIDYLMPIIISYKRNKKSSYREESELTPLSNPSAVTLKKERIIW